MTTSLSWRIFRLLTLVTALATLPAAAERPVSELQERQKWSFGGVEFHNQFPGARLNDCYTNTAGDFVLVISPEHAPINQSPWYAFEIRAESSRTIRLLLTNTYEGAFQLPRLSTDGRNWRTLPRTQFTRHDPTRTATFNLRIGPKPIRVAAQEMLGVAELEQWMDRKARLPFARCSVIGASLDGRPIRQLTFAATTNANLVLVIARQHPPEVTGSIGCLEFLDTVTGDSRLAREFRRQFQIVTVPLVNPDGVTHGQWRSNLGAKDLNRDWREFTQPESRATSAFLQQAAMTPGARPFLFLDFHSTRTNVFYAQPDGQAMRPFDFTRRWLANIHTRKPGLAFDRDDAHNPGQATSKAWANETFQIPAITFEYGYSSDRAAIRRSARVAAEEMMKLLLAELKSPSSPGPAPVATRGQ